MEPGDLAFVQDEVAACMSNKPAQRLQTGQIGVGGGGCKMVLQRFEIAVGKHKRRAKSVLTLNRAERLDNDAIPASMAKQQAAGFHATVGNSPKIFIHQEVDFMKYGERVGNRERAIWIGPKGEAGIGQLRHKGSQGQLRETEARPLRSLRARPWELAMRNSK